MNIKAYNILWWTIILLPFLPITLGPESAFDLQLYDTYFIFALWQFAMLFSLILELLGCVYWMLKTYKFIQIFSIIHSAATSLCLSGITIIAIFQNIYRSGNFELFRNLNTIASTLIMVFLGVQIVFFINITIGLVNGTKEISS